MFFQRNQGCLGLTVSELKLALGKVQAIDRVQAVIEFEPNGTIITANKNFLDLMGYSLDQVVGRHHRIFVEPGLANSPEYEAFWARLRTGEFASEKFKRVARDGAPVWIRGSYNPMRNEDGTVFRIVKFATDITETINARAAFEAEMAETARAQMQVVSSLAAGLNHLATGDLLHRIEDRFGQDFEQLRTDFNRAVASLQQTLIEVAGNAAAITSGSTEVSAAADDLSRRTEQQAASLEQTAATLDQITATVKKSADGASHARGVVANAKSDAEHSGEVVRKAVQAMGSIQESSQQISQIIGVIDEIAFQTNLLALNAGVEAARAGESGKGFAVVASEVRALAQRSAEAAKEIKALISTSSVHVGQGVELVGEAGKALDRIAGQVTEINGIVGEIALSAQEQSTAIQQVNSAINQMDQVTQQNAAMVEETTAASHTLAEEAEKLTSLIGRFQVGQIAAAARPARSAAKGARPASATPRRPAPAPTRAVGSSRGGSALRKAEVAPSEDWEEF
jgi:methyl-accepting chemotaxis protein